MTNYHVFPKKDMLGKFCTVNPDDRAEHEFNYLK